MNNHKKWCKRNDNSIEFLSVTSQDNESIISEKIEVSSNRLRTCKKCGIKK